MKRKIGLVPSLFMLQLVFSILILFPAQVLQAEHEFAAPSRILRKDKMPISWIKNNHGSNWRLVQGWAGLNFVTMNLVQVQEIISKNRGPASVEEIQYQVNFNKTNINELQSEDLKKNKLMIVIVAP